MNKLFFCTAIALAVISSCSKQPSLSLNEQKTRSIITSVSNEVNAVPINESASFDYLNYFWNPCLQEWIELKGTGHYGLHGMISDNKITYVVHFNLSDVKGIGLSSGTTYVTTQTFNYSNTNSFTGDQLVYQQSASMHFVATGGEGSFTVINDWHLTVNANGDVAFFFTTGGDVIECK